MLAILISCILIIGTHGGIPAGSTGDHRWSKRGSVNLPRTCLFFIIFRPVFWVGGGGGPPGGQGGLTPITPLCPPMLVMCVNIGDETGIHKIRSNDYVKSKEFFLIKS